MDGPLLFSEVKKDSSIYKEQCAFCHATAEFQDGLYLCLKSLPGDTFLAFCADCLQKLVESVSDLSHIVFLRIQRTRISPPKEAKDPANGSEPKISKLAIGIEGGAQIGGEAKFEENFKIVLLKPTKVEKTVEEAKSNPQLHAAVLAAIANEGAMRQANLDSGLGAWDGEARLNTKHLTLTQIPNPPKVAPSGWKCQWVDGCDKTDNLWLNLSDGTILCGRKFYDGSGGNNHALLHYEKTRYPLSVKLGTITAKGGDVFSYDEDDLVLDPNLAVHLAHFGINMTKMEKTEKTMAELELDLNQKYEWMAIQEEGQNLEPRYGPHFTGIINLGNSCYMNSCLQLLSITPAVENCFVSGSKGIFGKCQEKSVNPFSDEEVQFARVFSDLHSGRFSPNPAKVSNPNSDAIGIRPETFRRLIGQGHPEFSTKGQQDAEEYLRFLFEKIESLPGGDAKKITDQFKFKVEEKLKDKGSGLYGLKEREETILQLHIPLEAAENKAEVEVWKRLEATLSKEKQVEFSDKVVRPKVRLEQCLETFSAPSEIPDYRSPVTKEVSGAESISRFSTFPDYLLIGLRKFTVSPDWTPSKMDAEIIMPPTLDLDNLRGTGLQAGEDPLPKDVQEETAKAGSAEDEKVTMLTGMGFTKGQAKAALEVAGGNTNTALDMLLEGVIPATAEVEGAATKEAAPTAVFKDGPGKYKLRGFISHMGSNCHSGHYVAHIMSRSGEWTIFNDEKVAKSQKPPTSLGYIYMYERV